MCFIPSDLRFKRQCDSNFTIRHSIKTRSIEWKITEFICLKMMNEQTEPLPTSKRNKNLYWRRFISNDYWSIKSLLIIDNDSLQTTSVNMNAWSLVFVAKQQQQQWNLWNSTLFGKLDYISIKKDQFMYTCSCPCPCSCFCICVNIL